MDMNFDDSLIGISHYYEQTITDADIKAFAGISGDNNPVHMSDKYAEKSRFKKRIAHGFLLVGFFSGIFGTRFPGPGCVYVSQNVQFKRPVYIGDTVVAMVTVKSFDKRNRRIFFDTVCSVGGHEVICGEAEIYIPISKSI